MRNLICTFLFLLPCTAMATERSQGAGTTGTDEEKIICRSRMPVGSHIPKKECHTRREWRELSDREQEQFGSQRRQSRNGPDKNPFE